MVMAKSLGVEVLCSRGGMVVDWGGFDSSCLAIFHLVALLVLRNVVKE